MQNFNTYTQWKLSNELIGILFFFFTFAAWELDFPSFYMVRGVLLSNTAPSIYHETLEFF